MNPVQLSVIVPAYNEAKRIGTALEKIPAYCRSLGGSYELLIVDDGSDDKTAEVVRAAATRDGHIRLLSHAERCGKGAAVKTGVLASSGSLVLFSDADLSTPIEEFDHLRRALDEGYDIAIGSRVADGARIEVRQNLVRQTMGQTFNGLIRLLLVQGFKDTQCGFKLFRQNAALSIFARTRITGFAFDVEVLVIARQHGFKVKEVPVVWRNAPASKVQIILDPLKMFGDLFRIKANEVKGVYNPSK
jgi:dolichyl-phosphate beta-glucosyltransferase